MPPVVPEPPATPIAVDYAALTGGIAKTEDEFKAFLQTSNILKQQFTELQSQTAFRSDGSKQLFDLVNRIEGQPITAVLNYLRVKELDVEKLPGQQQRLEAFLLKPEVIATGMSQDDLRAAFLEQDVESFGDPSNEAIPRTSTQILNEKLATQAAKAALLKAKEDLKDFGKQAQGATVKTPEQLAAEQIEFRNLAQANIIGYNSMTMEVKTTNAEGKQVTGVAKVNFTPDQHERLLSLVSDPVAWWDKQILGSGAMNDKGEINWNKFADLGSRLEFQAEREEALYRQGREDAIAEFVSQHRNPPAPATSGSSAPPTVPVKAKSDMEIMAEGILGRVGK